MANASTDSSPRNISESCQFAKTIVELIAHQILPVIFLLTGTVGHLLGANVVWKESKKHHPYLYQFYIQITEIILVIQIFLDIACFQWFLDYNGQGASWFMSSYVCMFFAAYIDTLLFDFLAMLLLLLSLAGSADRLFGLAQPHIYQLQNHTKNRRIILAISILLSGFCSFWHIFDFSLDYDGRLYHLKFEIYLPKNIKSVFRCFLLAFQLLALMLLLICNMGSLVAFFKLPTYQIIANNKRAKDRKTAESTLLFITVCESILEIIFRGAKLAYTIVAMTSLSGKTCEGMVALAFLEIACYIRTALDFYLYILFSKPFRKVLAKHLSCKKIKVIQKQRNNPGAGTDDQNNTPV